MTGEPTGAYQTIFLPSYPVKHRVLRGESLTTIDSRSNANALYGPHAQTAVSFLEYVQTGHQGFFFFFFFFFFSHFFFFTSIHQPGLHFSCHFSPKIFPTSLMRDFSTPFNLAISM